MKKKLILTLLMLSLAVNLFIFGKWLLIEQWYTPSSEEKIILSEMIQKTVENEDYKKIAEANKIIAIEPSINRYNGGVFPYYFEVQVLTDKRSYVFYCSNKQCDTVYHDDSVTYSRYQDESPRLPFN